MCGLKPILFALNRDAPRVTPFVGVWIETESKKLAQIQYSVTPFVGVWIETLSNITVDKPTSSHTLRGCVD